MRVVTGSQEEPREAKRGHGGAKGRPMEPKREPKGRQGEAKRGPGKPKEAKAEKELSPAPNPYHFGIQNPTKFDLNSLKKRF